MTKLKILCIQFRKNIESIGQEQECVGREADKYVDIDYIDATDASLGWSYPTEVMSEYSGVILGGSGEFHFDGNCKKTDIAITTSYVFLERLTPLFKYIFKHDIPTLGICYGHQLLGAFAGVKIRYSEEEKKVCSHEVSLVVDKNDHFLFSELPESFHAHYGHKDVLDKVPDGAVLLMNGGGKCKVSALQYKNNIYTTQFHPELTFSDLVKRIKYSPGYLPEGVLVEEIFKNDSHSNTILKNFAKLIAMTEK